MSTAFDASAIELHGWRQGAVLGANLAVKSLVEKAGGKP